MEVKKKIAHREDERGVKDGVLGTDEASELAIGELLEGRRRSVNGGFRVHKKILHAPLPLLRFSSPAVSTEHAHLSLSLSLYGWIFSTLA